MEGGICPGYDHNCSMTVKRRGHILTPQGNYKVPIEKWVHKIVIKTETSVHYITMETAGGMYTDFNDS